MNNIAKYRAIKGMTQKELSEKCNLARTYISLLENGNDEKRLTLNAVTRLTRALECTIPELLGEDLFYFFPETDQEKIATILILVKQLENAELKQQLLSILK